MRMPSHADTMHAACCFRALTPWQTVAENGMCCRKKSSAALLSLSLSCHAVRPRCAQVPGRSLAACIVLLCAMARLRDCLVLGCTHSTKHAPADQEAADLCGISIIAGRGTAMCGAMRRGSCAGSAPRSAWPPGGPCSPRKRPARKPPGTRSHEPAVGVHHSLHLR